ncbi:MAG: hypothetical protein Q4F97_04415 [Bacteroidales bacterium]|nr:hypothetical protein [Bacteroidales bacterium]
MKHILILLMSVLIVSCSDPIDKSVIDTLSKSEQETISKKHHEFKFLYEMLQNIVAEIKETDSVSYQKLEPITYKRFCNVWCGDSLETENYAYESEIKWNNKYAGIEQKADSAIDYWKNEIDNSVLNTVNISYLGKQEKKNEKSNNYITELRIGFRANSSRAANIKKISFKLFFAPYDNAWDDVQFMNITLDRSLGEYVDVPLNFKDYFSIWKGDSTDYKYMVESIETDKGVFSLEKLNVPNSIVSYILNDNLNKTILFNSKTDVIKELFDPEYVTKDSYVGKAVLKMMKEKDPPVFDILMKKFMPDSSDL